MPDTSSQASKKERLVLRSGVGVGKALRTQSSAEVVDSWEEAEEKEEQAEQAEQEQGKTSIEVEVEAQPETAETAIETADQPAEVDSVNTPNPDIAEGDSEHV
jgi:transcriptional repressor NF-X1